MAELIDKNALLESMDELTYLGQSIEDIYSDFETLIYKQSTITEAEIRAKAIDEFIKRLYKIGEYREFDWEDIYRLKDEMKAEQLKLIGNSEQLNGWIPVEERLPEEDGCYLTCDAHGNIHLFRHCVGSKYPFAIDPNHQRFYQPIAWQPLPEPYQKGE